MTPAPTLGAQPSETLPQQCGSTICLCSDRKMSGFAGGILDISWTIISSVSHRAMKMESSGFVTQLMSWPRPTVLWALDSLGTAMPVNGTRSSALSAT